jgi:hypothetical protein
MYLSTTGLALPSASSQRQQDEAVLIVALATARIAGDLVDAGACKRSCEQRRPHAPVELG